MLWPGGETPPDDSLAYAWLRAHDVLNDAGTFAVLLVQRWVRKRR